MLVFVKGQGMIFVAHAIKQSTGCEINFFLKATRLLNSPKWWPIQKKLVATFKDKQDLFCAVSVLDRPSKIKLRERSFTCYKWTLGWMVYNVQAHLNPRWRLVLDRDACAAFWKQT